MDDGMMDNSEFFTCPYNKAHVMSMRKKQQHLLKCKLSYPNVVLEQCPFNLSHWFEESEMRMHIGECPDKRIVINYKYSIDSKVKEIENQVHYIQPIDDGDEPNWDNDVSYTKSYDPQKYAATASIVRSNIGNTPSERKEFSQNEILRYNKIRKIEKETIIREGAVHTIEAREAAARAAVAREAAARPVAVQQTASRETRSRESDAMEDIAGETEREKIIRLLREKEDKEAAFIRATAKIAETVPDSETELKKYLRSTPWAEETDEKIYKKQKTMPNSSPGSPKTFYHDSSYRDAFHHDSSHHQHDSSHAHHLKVAIMHENHPYKSLRESELEKIKSEILDEMDSGTKNCIVPQFVAYYIRSGILSVICKNKSTREWVKNIIPTIQLYNDLKIKVIGVRETPETYYAVLYVPPEDDIPRDKFIRRLSMQNPEIDISSWKIEKKLVNDDGGGEYYVFLDDASKAYLDRKQYYLFFNFGQLYVHFLEPDPRIKNEINNSAARSSGYRYSYKKSVKRNYN